MSNLRKFVILTVFALIASASSVRAQEATTENSLLSGWTGDVFAGYTLTNGNTKKASGSFSASATKKIDKSTFLLKGNLFYSEANDTMDGQKWDALTKYSLDFGTDDNWFTFAQVFVDHDYFADIDYRVTPSGGLGYHISKTDDFKWDVDAGLGYRITRHRVNTTADDEALTAIAHTFAKKSVFEKAYVSEDLTIYPALESDAGTLIHSESVFGNPLTGSMDLELKYIVDYNTEPAAGKKKTDTVFTAGLKYKF